MDNSELAKRISTFLNAQSEPVSKKELLKAVGKLFADVENGKPAKKIKEGVEKKKREPTKYNLFVKEQMAVLKARVQNAETELNNREMMARIGTLWQAQKTDENPEIKDEVKEVKTEKKLAKKPAKEEKKTIAKKTTVAVVEEEESESDVERESESEDEEE